MEHSEEIFKITRGASGVHNTLSTFLSGNVPAIIDGARIAWELDEYRLPYPKKYSPYAPFNDDAMPAVNTIVQKDGTWEFIDYDATGAGQYRVVWDVKLHVWVSTPTDIDNNWLVPEYESTVELRDDMVTIIRATLLSDHSLGDMGYHLMSETISTDYLEVRPLGESRPDFVTVATISFNMSSTESIARRPLGVVEFISTDVAPLNTMIGYVP